jgi:hypothetical protein
VKYDTGTATEFVNSLERTIIKLNENLSKCDVSDPDIRLKYENTRGYIDGVHSCLDIFNEITKRVSE